MDQVDFEESGGGLHGKEVEALSCVLAVFCLGIPVLSHFLQLPSTPFSFRPVTLNMAGSVQEREI